MLYQLLILLGLLIFFLNFVLNLLLLKRPSKKIILPEDLPLVSVMVPARNEKENIESCLCSLLQQDYPNFEVLALDDSSTDGTFDVMQHLATTDRRLRIFKGKPLPPGWAGKCYACHQLAQEARGEWLLFADADTICQPWAIRSTLAIAQKYNLSLLSGFPRQKLTGISSNIVIPILFYFIIMSWFPLWWFHRSPGTRPTLPIGQFMLFKKQEYYRIGGHELVRSRIMEDVWFGIEMGRHGGRCMSVDLSRTVETNAYTDISDMTEGCLKWFQSVAILSPVALIGFFLAAFIFYLQPFYYGLQILSLINISKEAWSDWMLVVLLQISLILLMRLIADVFFRNHPTSFLFHPLGMAFLVLSVFYAFIRRLAGAGVAWKERVYQAISHVK